MATAREKWAVRVLLVSPPVKTKNVAASSSAATSAARRRPPRRSRSLVMSSPLPRDELAGRHADQVGDVGVEPGAGADHVDQDRGIGLEVVDRGLDVGL